MAVTDIFDDLKEQTILINHQGVIVYANSSAQMLVYGDTLKQCGLIALSKIVESMIHSHEMSVQQFNALQDNHVKYDVKISRFHSFYAVRFHSLEWLKGYPHHEQGRYQPAIEAADLSRELDETMAFLDAVLPTLNTQKYSSIYQQLIQYQVSIKRDIKAYHFMMSETSFKPVVTSHSADSCDRESTLTLHKKHSVQCLKRPLLKLVK
jgi:hypothetical protein